MGGGRRRFMVGECMVDPSCNRIMRDGVETQLEPRIMALLVSLADRDGAVATRRELIDAVWGAEFVSDNSLTAAVAELRGVLGDDARSPRFVETIPKRGYRMIASVRWTDDSGAVPRIEASAAVAPRSRRWWRVLRAAAVVSFVAAATILVAAVPWLMEPTGAVAPRIVVLPFAPSGEAEAELFASGLAEEITSRLASLSGLVVVSRTSALVYDRRDKTLRDIGRELTVDYVLEGGVQWQCDGNGRSCVRVTPRLVRTADDVQVWASAYMRPVDELFAVQAEIGREVVEQLGVRLHAEEGRSLAEVPAADLSAYQAFLQGTSFMYSGEKCDMEKAVAMLENAVAMEPDFVIAHARLALVHALLVHFDFDADGGHELAAREALARAEALAPDHPEVRLARGMVLNYLDGRLADALVEFRAVVEVIPNHSQALAGASYVLRRLGRWEASRELLQRALAIDPLNVSEMWNMGSTLLYMHRYDEAEQVLQRAMDVAPGMRTPQLIAALVYRIGDGDTVRARRVVEALPGPHDERWLMAAYANEVFDGRFEEALELVRNTPAPEVNGHPRDALECMCLMRLNRRDEAATPCAAAVGRLQETLRSHPDDAGAWMSLAELHAVEGRCDDARFCARQALAELEGLPLGPAEADIREAMARVLTMTGENGAALDEIEMLLHNPSLLSRPAVAGDARLAPLRADPRFEELVRQ